MILEPKNLVDSRIVTSTNFTKESECDDLAEDSLQSADERQISSMSREARYTSNVIAGGVSTHRNDPNKPIPAFTSLEVA